MRNLAEWGYLITAVLFILGIMRLRTPRTARSGNALAALGMLVATVAVLVGSPVRHLPLLVAAVLAGAVIGGASARLVRMTAMPQMVALFNGMGGGAAALISLGEIFTAREAGVPLPLFGGALSLFTILIGAVSLLGSLVAFGKLQEWLTGRPVTFAGQKILNAALLLALLVAGAVLLLHGMRPIPTLVLYAVGAGVLGVLVVLPVGGADMPVIISLLNSLTGLAAATTGLVLGNNALVVAGALVGASGTILTQLMSRAMNRPLSNVLFGAFGTVRSAQGDKAQGGQVRATTPEDVAALLAFSRRVVIVPGYGLAAARAQQEVRDLMDGLLARGVDVRFGIHPVAGRMPGHMNVLLAEVDIPYDRLYDMDEINPEFPHTDVVLVVGANDVTNPAARTDPSSPIYGMPILNVDQARTVVVLKRSMNPGFAGIDNPLYTNPKTLMLFGDARASLTRILQAMKEAA